ncbi:MAG: hypothetical protein NTU66_00255 [Elusimicrobia bacterium]|nr:hypothetical protein [Elusimicrobiota bacterium]
MNRLRRTKLLTLLIPMLLVLGAATPTLDAESLFGQLQTGQPMLVYNFVWVPILEVSVMIAERILPAKTILPLKTDCNQNQKDQPQAASTDFLMNALPGRDFFQIPFRFAPAAIAALLVPVAPPELNRPDIRAFRDMGIILLISLVFLFKPALPRSDVPL